MYRSKKELEALCIYEDSSLRDAVKKMDEAHRGAIFGVGKKNRLKGILTDGDFRELVLSDTDLNISLSKVMNKNPIFIDIMELNDELIENTLKKKSIYHLPILKNGKIFDIALVSDFFGADIEIKNFRKKIDLPVVIMAGGKGTRLDPFTRILPKPLIPIGNKAMIEIIMDEYMRFGMKKFYISINHKGKMIRAYLEDHESDYKFKYITENKPLGTAGALKYLEGKIDSPFFVSNCDIIIKDDYTKIYDFHKKGNYALTLVASMQNHVIPYGVCEIENGGILKSIQEKPQYDFLVNTGMYILNPEVLEFIPQDTFFDMTDLIKILQQNEKLIGVFPVSEKSWIDVGQWGEYKKSVEYLIK